MSTLTQLFTSIANAIRAKKGTSALIEAEDFPTEIAGIQTGIDTSDATATAGDILKNKTAYAKGEKITGTITNSDYLDSLANEVIYDSANNFLNLKTTRGVPAYIRNYAKVGTQGSNIASQVGLTANKIKKGEVILGVTGSYAGTTPTGTLTITENGLYDISNYANVMVNRVPTYQALEYIQSTGSQYIDTGISGGTNATYELWLNPLSTKISNWEQYFAGARSSTIPKIYQNTGELRTQVGNNPEITIGTATDMLYKIIFQSDGKLIVNDVEKGTFSNDGWGNLTWYVFNSHGESTLLSAMKLYKLKMYEGVELIRDFIPAKKLSNNEICLYDLVTRSFFSNAGTGSFTAGNPV